MLKAYKEHIKTAFSTLKKAKILVAFSGGIDSVVMTHLLHSLGYDITLAHCNFKLREQESDDDEIFSLKFADDLGVECFVQQFETSAYAKQHKLSIQMAARELRYDWFADLQQSFQFDYVLTAHHADDSIETFFINLLRGTGLNGLTGIPETNGSILRTMLPFTRHQIELYAQELQLIWREDSSNLDTKYLRNKIRHQLIPKLVTIDKDFQSCMLTTMRQLRESKNIISDQVANLEREGVVSKNNGELTIDVNLLSQKEHVQSYLFYLLQSYGFTAWSDIKSLLSAQSGKYVDAPEWRLLKNREQLILERKSISNHDHILVNELDTRINTSLGILTLDVVESLPETINTNECYVDYDALKFPLVIRNWQAGDYFYPLNGNGKKKLSKFFKDLKKSAFDKEKELLICNANNAIIWIVTERADHRFRVLESTTKTLRIHLK